MIHRSILRSWGRWSSSRCQYETFMSMPKQRKKCTESMLFYDTCLWLDSIGGLGNDSRSTRIRIIVKQKGKTICCTGHRGVDNNNVTTSDQWSMLGSHGLDLHTQELGTTYMVWFEGGLSYFAIPSEHDTGLSKSMFTYTIHNILRFIFCKIVILGSHYEVRCSKTHGRGKIATQRSFPKVRSGMWKNGFRSQFDDKW